MPAFRQSRARSLIWRIGGLTLIRAVSAVIPLIALPVVARHATTTDWAALGIGTSLGTVGAVVVNLGWSLTGPPLVAGQDAFRAARVLIESRESSLATFYVVAPLVAVASAALAPPTSSGLTAATAVAVTASGLSVSWHISAQGKTRELAVYDMIPRLVAGLSGAFLVAYGGRTVIWTYPLALGLAALIGPYFYARRHRIASSTGESGGLVLALRQSTPTLTGLLGTVYSGLSLALIALVTTTSQVASFSSALRIYLIALPAIMIVNHATIGWAVWHVGPTPHELRTACALYLGLALLGLAFFATVGPQVGRSLFSDNHSFNLSTSAALGCAFAALALHTFANTHLLLPYGETRAGLHATVLGVMVGVPSTLLLGQAWGASGGALAVALAEATVATYLLAVAWHRRTDRAA